MDSQALIATAKKLLAIPSTADKPQELHKALELVADIVRAVPGVTIERFERNSKPSFLAYTGKRRPKKFSVLLNGHVDVVAARSEQFEPRERNGKLYGRGALDMKVATLVLTDVFCRAAPVVSYPLALQIVSDEETGGANGTAYQIEQGVAANFVIAGEFSRPNTICNESRGICWLEVTFAGTAAHSAYLWNGHNALLDAQDFVAKLLKHYPVPTDEIWATTVNVASVGSSNATMNRVPDDAKLLLDIRYVADDPVFASKASVLAFAHSLDPKAAVTIRQFEASHYADPNNLALQQLAATLHEVTGQPASFIRKHGAADVRFYSAQGNTAVVYGLAGEGLHGDEEYVELASIPVYQTVLKRFLEQL